MQIIKHVISSIGVALVALGLMLTTAKAVPLGVGDAARVDFAIPGNPIDGPYDLITYTFLFGDGTNTQPISDAWDPADSIRIDWFATDGTVLTENSVRGPGLTLGVTGGWGSFDLFDTPLDARAGYGIVTVLAGSIDLSQATVGLSTQSLETLTPIVTAQISPVSEVPLPAALPLLLSALGFFGFMGWHRRKTVSA